MVRFEIRRELVKVVEIDAKISDWAVTVSALSVVLKLSVHHIGVTCVDR